MRFQISLFLLVFCFSLSAQSKQDRIQNEKAHNEQYRKNIQLPRINGVYIPVNMNDAFVELDRLSDKDSKAKFKSAPEEVVESKLHFGLGRWIMYNWNFYEGSRFSHYLKEMGVSFPDDMAKFVIVSYHRHLNGLDLELEKRSAEIAEKRRLEYLNKIDAGNVIKEETRQRKGGQ